MVRAAGFWLEEAERRQKEREGEETVEEAAAAAEEPSQEEQLQQAQRELKTTFGSPVSSHTQIQDPAKHRTRRGSDPGPSAFPTGTFPMVEVSRPEGAMLVHRHWTDKDLLEAASTLPDPAKVGGHTGSSHADQVQPWEAHLCNSFLLGLKPELSNAIKQHCVGYARQPLSVIEDHAKNHENLLNSQARKRFRAKQRKRIRRKTDQLFSQINNNNSTMRRMAMRTGLTGVTPAGNMDILPGTAHNRTKGPLLW
ncbi:hypothetical protein SRHO_G00059010 [Serrasalmus rhombeus]